MKRTIAILLALTLMLGLFAACNGNGGQESSQPSHAASTEDGGSSAESTPEGDEPAGEDFSQAVSLSWYSIGDAPTDGQTVMAEFNQVLKDRYNTTIDISYTGWDNWENQYNLLLTSGEKIDLIYTNPTAYNRYAKTGAYLDITELFPTFMPETYSFFTEEELSEIAVDGRIYGIPASRRGYIPYGVFYRTDLAEKHDLAPITDVESFEAYMDGIKAGEPDMYPYNGNPEYGIGFLFRSLYGFETIAGDYRSIVVARSYDDIEDILAYPFTDEYVEWAHRMKGYADKGYWSSNAISATLGTWDTVQVGTSATSIENPDGVATLVNNIANSNPDFTFDYWSFTDITGYAIPNVLIQDGMAVPKAAANPERSLMILEKIKTEQDLYDLFMYGQEGYHYDLNGEGKLVVPSASQDPGTVSGYAGPTSIGWGMRVEALERTNETEWEGLAPLMDTIRAKSVQNKFGPAVLDYTDVQAELAAVTQVIQQYGTPINIGLVEDVDAAVVQYRSNLDDAGIEALVESVRTQMLTYYAEKGIS